MTVTDIILNFRAALLAVLPMVEAVGIPWRRGDAYDEWDDLAACMYTQLVSNVVLQLDASSGGAHVRLAAYDMMLDDYRQCATIDVRSSSLAPGRWVFHAFETIRTPFDAVEVRELDSEGVPHSEVLRTCPIVGSAFSLTRPDGSNIDRLAVSSIR